MSKKIQKEFQKSKNLVIIAVLILSISIILAWLYYPFIYSPLNNWISDLGNPLLNTGALYLNFGIIITGFFLAILFTRGKNPLIIIIGVVMCASMILVGLYPENVPILHSFTADITCMFEDTSLVVSGCKHPHFIIDVEDSR